MLMCRPQGVTYEQITAIFKYLQDHPQDWHLSAASLVLFSIKNTYTCETKEKTIEQKF